MVIDSSLNLGPIARGSGISGQLVERTGPSLPEATSGPSALVREATAAMAAGLRDVTVIVVTFNSEHCLPSLGQSLGCCANITVVDNASQDGTAAAVARHLPQARFVALNRNLGFGAANNIALHEVRTPFALLLNPDCEITPDNIARLVQAAGVHRRAAILAPQLLHEDDEADINYRWPRGSWISHGMVAAQGPACVGFVSGAAMLFRVAAFEGIGFFDEAFFLYYEDDDLCQRLFAARREIIVVPDVTARHNARGSVRGLHPLQGEYLRGYHHAQSKLTFIHKHGLPAEVQATRGKLLWATALMLPLRALVFSPRHSARMLGRLRGLIDWKAEQRQE